MEEGSPQPSLAWSERLCEANNMSAEGRELLEDVVGQGLVI